MVFKSIPDVYGKHLNSEIGSPCDYQKNKENDNFPSSYDLRVPSAKTDDFDDNDLVGALDGFALDSTEEKKDADRSAGGARSGAAVREYRQSSRIVSPQDSMQEAYMPIKALNQFSTDWIIKARVVRKGEMRPWKNQRGEGRLINVDLVDREGTLIQGTGFNETAERLDGQLEADQVYTFQGAQIKLANKRFTSIKNDFCLTFDLNTVIEKCGEDKQITSDGFSFTSFEGIEALVQNCTIDVIGIILEVGQTGSITLRSGEQRLKRTLVVGDDMKVSIGLTLWGDTCEAYQFEVGQIVAFKSCRVSEYQGRSLNSSGDPRDITINPRHSRALELQKW